jgi:hypothetical protein
LRRGEIDFTGTLMFSYSGALKCQAVSFLDGLGWN